MWDKEVISGILDRIGNGIDYEGARKLIQDYYNYLNDETSDVN